jgi:hypothetical protein
MTSLRLFKGVRVEFLVFWMQKNCMPTRSDLSSAWGDCSLIIFFAQDYYRKIDVIHVNLKTTCIFKNDFIFRGITLALIIGDMLSVFFFWSELLAFSVSSEQSCVCLGDRA